VWISTFGPTLNGAGLLTAGRRSKSTLRSWPMNCPLANVSTYSNAFLVESSQNRNKTSRAALRTAYDQMVRDGFKGLHYLAGDGLLGSDGDATVDGSHPTDLGFYRQADAFEAALRPILSYSGSR